jgi:hypothetical protein
MDLRLSRSSRAAPWLPVLALALAVPALAGRSLDEPPGPGKIVKGAPRADVDKAIAGAHLAERCTREALKAVDLLGLECRAVAATLLVRAKPNDTKPDVDARMALFNDLSRAATQVSSWEPLAPPPGLARARFDAHRALAASLFSLLDDLVDAREKARTQANSIYPDVDAFLKANPEPKTQSCQAAQRSLELAVGGDATQDERGSLQSLLTSHACFLEESRLRAEPRPGAVKDSKDAAVVAASATDEGAIKEYATSRSLDLDRCQKHLDATGKPKDAARLEQCACGAINRWKLPARAHAVSTVLPVSAQVGVAVEVAPNGAVARCGPLSVKP